MTTERFNQLMNDKDGKLTQRELAEGWHFCIEYDFLLCRKLTLEGFSCELKQEPQEHA